MLKIGTTITSVLESKHIVFLDDERSTFHLRVLIIYDIEMLVILNLDMLFISIIKMDSKSKLGRILFSRFHKHDQNLTFSLRP